MVPRHKTETFKPVRPRERYSIFLLLGVDLDVSGGKQTFLERQQDAQLERAVDHLAVQDQFQHLAYGQHHQFQLFAFIQVLPGGTQVAGEEQVGGRPQCSGELVVVTEALDALRIIAGLLFELAAGAFQRVFAGIQPTSGQIVNYPADRMTVLASEDDLLKSGHPDSGNRFNGAGQVEVATLASTVLEGVDNDADGGMVENGLAFNDPVFRYAHPCVSANIRVTKPAAKELSFSPAAAISELRMAALRVSRSAKSISASM